MRLAGVQSPEVGLNSKCWVKLVSSWTEKSSFRGLANAELGVDVKLDGHHVATGDHCRVIYKNTADRPQIKQLLPLGGHDMDG